MNIQIFGTKKSSDSKKAERFFKERGIKFQYRDLSEKGVSKGELENIKRCFDVDDLIDKEGKQYKKRNLAYIMHDVEEELLSDGLLFKMPIVRNGNKSTIGYEPDEWKKWIEE
ncbi:MAG: arsenate reductase family protein [Rhodothermaceae bacterium]